MRYRVKLGLKIAGVVTLLSAAVAVPVLAQTPQYYPPAVTPAPPGTLPPTTIRPGYGVNTTPAAPPGGSATKPRLTQPVIAGAEGVRPASATDIDITMPKVPAVVPGAPSAPFFPPPPAVTGDPLPTPSLPGALPPASPTVTPDRPTIVVPGPAVTPMSPVPSLPPAGLTPAPALTPSPLNLTPAPSS